MKNEKATYDIKDEPIVFSKAVSDLLLKQDKPTDLITLYHFYYYTAKWQQTNQPKATMPYIRQALGWGPGRIKNAKRKLRQLKLIETIRHKSKSGQIVGHFVKVNFIWHEKPTIGTIFHRMGNRSSNALITNNKYILKEFLKNFPQDWIKNQQFLSSVKDYITHRKQKHAKLTKIAMRRLANKLTKFDINTVINALDNSVENGWTGVFPKKQNGKEEEIVLRTKGMSPIKIMRKHFQTGSKSWIKYCYKPAAELIQADDDDKWQLAMNLCALKDWYHGRQNPPDLDEDADESSHPQHRLYRIWMMNIPRAFDLIEGYVKWLQDQDWINEITPKHFNHENRLFLKYLKSRQKEIGYNFFTGKSL